MPRPTQVATDKQRRDLKKAKEGDAAKTLLDVLVELEADTKTQTLTALEKAPASDLLSVQTQYKAVLKVKNWLTSKVNSGKLAQKNLSE